MNSREMISSLSPSTTTEDSGEGSEAPAAPGWGSPEGLAPPEVMLAPSGSRKQDKTQGRDDGQLEWIGTGKACS